MEVNKNEKLVVGESGFWAKWSAKLFFTIISVKVWGLVAATWVSTSLLVNSSITNAQWLTFNTTIWALIFGMKEIFRISEEKEKAETVKLDKALETKEKVAKITANPSMDANQTMMSKEGFEVVGEEADKES